VERGGGRAREKTPEGVIGPTEQANGGRSEGGRGRQGVGGRI